MLSLLLWLPVIGAALVGFYPGNLEYSRLRQITITVTAIIFAISLYLLNQFNLSISGMQFVEYHNWLPQIGLSYSLGVDGLSLPC